MRAKAKYFEIGLSFVVIMAFGLMSASNMGMTLAVTRAGLLDDEQAAACLGGATCSPTGGPNCGDSSHACTTGDCTATSSLCTWNGTMCVMLGQLSPPWTFPCARRASENCPATSPWPWR
ncbi:MAG: hypothetical protein ACP5XB_23115, partial [Isosphaeraceae bacterium]